MDLDSTLAGDITLYIISDIGQCLAFCELADQEHIDQRTRIDEQLVAGFVSAIMNFGGEFEEGHIKSMSTVFDDYATEFRVMSNIKANELIADPLVELVPFKFYGLMVLRRLGELERITYSNIDSLNRDILYYLDVKRPDVIDGFLSNGVSCYNEVTGFVKNCVLNFKEQLYSTYMLKVLSLAAARNTKRNKSLMMLPFFDKVQQSLDDDLFSVELIYDHNLSCADKIRDLRSERFYRKFDSVIKEVNDEFGQVLNLFKKPLI